MSGAYEPPPPGAVGWIHGPGPPGDDSGLGGGYRQLGDGTNLYEIQGNGSFRDFLNALESATPWTWSTASDGRMQITAGTDELLWFDRLGWLLGFDREGTSSEGVVTPPLKAPKLSPALIPLFSRRYEVIDRDRERQLIIDRFGRGHGYVFGRVDVWRWHVRMHRTGLEAFKAGWCARGPIVLTPYTMDQHRSGSVTGWSPSTPGGYVNCRILGTEGDAEPLDRTRRMFDLRLLTVTAVEG